MSGIRELMALNIHTVSRPSWLNVEGREHFRAAKLALRASVRLTSKEGSIFVAFLTMSSATAATKHVEAGPLSKFRRLLKRLSMYAIAPNAVYANATFCILHAL